MRKRKTAYTIILLKKNYNDLKYSMQIQTDKVKKYTDKIQRYQSTEDSNAQIPAVYQ